MSALNLEARAQRMDSILRAMAAKEATERPEKFSGKVTPKLRKQLDAIQKLPAPILEEFLDLLEAGVPAEFRHVLEEKL